MGLERRGLGDGGSDNGGGFLGSRDVCILPVYQVFQPLPLFLVLIQLLLPDLHLIRRHPLQEPSLSHGLGLEEEAETRLAVSC